MTATNLSSLVNTSTGQVFQTEVGGFTIASPLVGDPALGTINPNAIGLYADNSNILIDRDYFIDAGSGILVTTSGASSQAPQIENDGIIGNINGVVVQDGGASNPATTTEVINNTFAYNTTGLVALNSATTGSEQAYVANNIFWQNHDQTLARNGAGVISQTVNKLVLNNNLFSGNGASDTSTAYAAENIGNGFDPTLLGPLAANAAADLGNFTGYPAFVAPYDPRPGSDGPATFFLDANFGLLSTSAAINNALESVATKTDFLGNPENPNPTTMGFKLPGYGPRDVGASSTNHHRRRHPLPYCRRRSRRRRTGAHQAAGQAKAHRAGEETQGGSPTEAQDRCRDPHPPQATDLPREVGQEEMINAALQRRCLTPAAT